MADVCTLKNSEDPPLGFPNGWFKATKPGVSKVSKDLLVVSGKNLASPTSKSGSANRREYE